MPYLSSLFVTKEDGQEQSRKDSRVELLFNYLGKYQQLESKNAFFSQIDLEGDAVAVSQFDPKLERFSLIDISVVVTHGKLASALHMIRKCATKTSYNSRRLSFKTALSVPLKP